MRLAGRVALVTGASRGIGAATAKSLAAEGAAVAVNFRNSAEKAAAVVAAIRDNGGVAKAFRGDVTDEREVAAMCQSVVEEFGAIDTLILNAGATVPMKMFVELTFVEFEKKVMGELRGFFFPLKEVVPGMITMRRGSIVGISSALSRYPAMKFSAHSTVKSGIDGFMRALAFELGPHGIRVNTVAPGLTETDATARMPREFFEMIGRETPLQRVAQPEDVAGAVLMMASEDAKFVTGSYIHVGGGIQML